MCKLVFFQRIPGITGVNTRGVETTTNHCSKSGRLLAFDVDGYFDGYDSAHFQLTNQKPTVATSTPSPCMALL